jgi:NAD-dependent deacetylase
MDERDSLDAAGIAEAAAILRGARRVLFVTGAGLSADSGLPTYRGVGGLYEGQLTELGIPIEVALSGAMMARSPAISWRYIAAIEQRCRGARPNRGHRVIAALESVVETVVTLTQNVEGLHQAAGSTRVIDIHGDVFEIVCLACGRDERLESYEHLPIPPRCLCGAPVRPRVVLFGEPLLPDRVARLHEELERGFDAVFSVGTSSLFPYIADPVLDAAANGVPTVEINPGETEVSDAVRLRLRSRAAVTLDAIAEAVGLDDAPPGR